MNCPYRWFHTSNQQRQQNLSPRDRMLAIDAARSTQTASPGSEVPQFPQSAQADFGCTAILIAYLLWEIPN